MPAPLTTLQCSLAESLGIAEIDLNLGPWPSSTVNSLGGPEEIINSEIGTRVP